MNGWTISSCELSRLKSGCVERPRRGQPVVVGDVQVALREVCRSGAMVWRRSPAAWSGVMPSARARVDLVLELTERAGERGVRS